MATHPVDANDLVLQVRRPRITEVAKRPGFAVSTFPDRRIANIALREGIESWTCVSLAFDDQLQDYRRKVNAVNEFRPDAQPTNPIASGIPAKIAKRARVTREPIPEGFKFKMDLHRALLCGNGFYKVLVLRPDETQIDQLADALGKVQPDGNPKTQATTTRIRSLPAMNLIELPDDVIAARMGEILVADRDRLVNYLTKRPFGLVIVVA
ncbi:hypothetical protein HDV63DRAFT_264590 [Trichoderma sp. SZMC 28014]